MRIQRKKLREKTTPTSQWNFADVL